MLSNLLRCNRRPPASTYVPSVRALGMTGYAPTISGIFDQIPPVRAMALTGHAPTIQRSSPLTTTVIDLTSEYYQLSSNRRYWGAGKTSDAELIGAVSPLTMGGYWITDLLEFANNLPIYRLVWIELSGGPGPLTQDSISSIDTTIGGNLPSSSATFTSFASGGRWTWTVTTGGYDTTADYLTSGYVTVNV